MDEIKALSIVSALAHGVNPLTGEMFPADSPYQTPDVIRALFLVSQLLESRAKSRSRTPTPSNAGKPWTADEDQKLLQEFDRGNTIQKLAMAHGRTAAGIQARLEKHGRVEGAANGGSPPGSSRQWRGSADRSS